MSKHSEQRSRRDFLKKATLTATGGMIASHLPPIEKFLELLSTHLIQRAHANNPSATARYVVFHFRGAPARWCFDQILQTKPEQTLNGNASVTTRLVGDGTSYTDAEYSTFEHDGLFLPTLWQQPVWMTNGSKRSLLDLMPHFIHLRGYGSGIDGHVSNSARQTNPVPAAGSLSGHLADSSKTLFKALQFPHLGEWSGYHSPKATGLTLVHSKGRANYISDLFAPFIQRGDSYVTEHLRSRFEASTQEVYKQIRFIASQKYSGLSPLDIDYRTSVKTLKDGLGDLEASWPSLYAKYESLILENIKDRTVPGLSDRPIIAHDGPQFSAWVSGRTIRPKKETDLRDWLNQVDCSLLISSFALTEFVLTRGYSTAIELGELIPYNLVGTFEDQAEPLHFVWDFDQHGSGSVPTTFVNSLYFRALGAALLELTDQLKKSDLFHNTFLHLTQEFGRSPRTDGSGSDHGFDAMISTLITGANQERPLVVGNIARSLSQGLYSGTWGEKALTRIGADYETLNPSHVTSTIAHLMQLERNPWANVAPPLITRTIGAGLRTLATGEIV